MRKWSTSRSIRSIHSNTDYWFVNKRPFVAGFFLPFSPISISICIHYPPLPVFSLSPNPASSEPNWNFRADERPRIYTNILNEIKQFLNQVFRFPVRGKRRFRGKRFPIPDFPLSDRSNRSFLRYKEGVYEAERIMNRWGRLWKFFPTVRILWIRLFFLSLSFSTILHSPPVSSRIIPEKRTRRNYSENAHVAIGASESRYQFQVRFTRIRFR